MNQLEAISQQLSEINRLVMSLFAMQSAHTSPPVFRSQYGEDDALDKFFADKPYKMIGFVGCNRMYARTDDKELMREIYPTA